MGTTITGTRDRTKQERATTCRLRKLEGDQDHIRRDQVGGSEWSCRCIMGPSTCKGMGVSDRDVRVGAPLARTSALKLHPPAFGPSNSSNCPF